MIYLAPIIGIFVLMQYIFAIIVIRNNIHLLKGDYIDEFDIVEDFHIKIE